MQNTWLGRRGTCSGTHSVESRPDTDHDDRPWNRVRGSEITMAAQPTTSNGWRLGFRHGRHDQRQATTSERQRLVRQEEAATRYSHSRRRCVNDVRRTNSLRRSVLDSTATQVNGSTSARSPTRQLRSTHSSAAAHTRTAARQLARPATPTHTRTHSPTHCPTTSLTTTGVLSFTHSAQLLELNSIYTVSRLHDRLTVY